MRPRVLVVDDEGDFVGLLEYNLTRKGYDVFAAGTGGEALSVARRVKPDVVLLDLMLPDMDGISVCESLRSDPATAEVPIIVLSMLDGQITRRRSTEAGVTRYFNKLADLSEIGDCIRSLTE